MRDPFRKTRQEGTETVTYDATIEVEMQHKIDAQSILASQQLFICFFLLPLPIASAPLHPFSNEHEELC